MFTFFKRYTRWLQRGNPTGRVEKMPRVGPDGRTNVPGLFIAGDLGGIPLLKFASETGAEAVRAIAKELGETNGNADGSRENPFDVVVVGAGIAGVAAGMQARESGLSCALLESSRPFSTITNFPKRKPIFTYPNAMDPRSPLKVSAEVKEDLCAELETQLGDAGLDVREGVAVRAVAREGGVFRVAVKGADDLFARRVVLAIGRSGNYRRLGIPGEDLGKVTNRLHDPKDSAGKNVLVVGGGDSAAEAAVALAEAGAAVTLSYRGAALTRPKPENTERVMQLASEDGGAGRIRLMLGSTPLRFEENSVVFPAEGGKEKALSNDIAFVLIGREPPLQFLRRCGLRIRGEWTKTAVASFLAFMVFISLLMVWKKYMGWAPEFPAFPASWRQACYDAARPTLDSAGAFHPDGSLDHGSLACVVMQSSRKAVFWYTLAYSVCVVAFGIGRMRRRRTPYVAVQTLTLMAIQVFPLFLLPEILLPWLNARDAVPATLIEHLFPPDSAGGAPTFWRAYGFILAWPLMMANIVAARPLWWWHIIGAVQTFVIIPLLIRKWGKGAYCGWICSCGALAETLGDTSRDKALHGPGAKRLDMAGQVILALAVVVTLLKAATWLPWAQWSPPMAGFMAGTSGALSKAYGIGVDLVLSGMVGIGFYFWFSGRFWCRHFCPLAALMHIYAKFSRFRIFPEKKKCISCNVCTSVCHMGIDVMNYANKGRAMDDVECVRCSACVQSCPTNTLSFGELRPDGTRASAILRATVNR